MGATLTHNDYQQNITDAAKLMHWRHLHVRKSIGKGKTWQTTTNRVGWPDLFLWHAKHGFLAIEVKVGADKPSPEQLEVLEELRLAGAVVMVAYPADWDSVVLALQGKPIPRHNGDAA